MKFSMRFSIKEKKVERVIENTENGRTLSTNSIDIDDFVSKLGIFSDVDLGFLPDGVKFFRQKFGYAQIVVELPPGINRNIWGDEEGDPDAEHYMLAQPYRVIIIDFRDGNFFGARIFYSTTPIYNLDIPLYNTNLSNVNCYGYNGNAVGWLCLYNNENLADMPWEYKIRRMIERASGEEAFNFGNMSETDGIKLYGNHSEKRYLSDVSLWEKKSEEEGFEWALDPSLWIPVMVESMDDQDRNNFNPNAVRYDSNEEMEYYEEHEDAPLFRDGSVPLTLRMALDGAYAATYDDKHDYKPPSPHFKLEESHPVNQRGHLERIFNQAFSISTATNEEQNPF